MEYHGREGKTSITRPKVGVQKLTPQGSIPDININSNSGNHDMNQKTQDNYNVDSEILSTSDGMHHCETNHVDIDDNDFNGNINDHDQDSDSNDRSDTDVSEIFKKRATKTDGHGLNALLTPNGNNYNINGDNNTAVATPTNDIGESTNHDQLKHKEGENANSNVNPNYQGAGVDAVLDGEGL